MMTLLAAIPGVGPVLAFLFSPAGRIALIVIGAVGLYGTGWIKGRNYEARKNDIASLKNTIEVTKRDLKAEKDARANDIAAVKELSAEKEAAERKTDELRQYVDTLSQADRCIATPDRLKQLHRTR